MLVWFGWTEVLLTLLLSFQIYAAGVIYFASNCAFGSISAFLPTIITTFGFSASSAPPS